MSTDSGFARAQLPVVSDERTRDIRERARVSGYAEGWAQGSRAAAQAARVAAERQAARIEQDLRAAQERLARAVEVLEHAARAAAARAEPVLEQARGTLLTQSVELAQALVGVELSDGARSARSVITRALAVPDDVEVVTIRLNAADLAALDADLDSYGLAMPVPDGVRLVADARLAPGDARSEYDGGFLDARIDAAAARARAALADLLTQTDAITEAELMQSELLRQGRR